MLKEDTTLLEGAEGSQVIGSKHKEASPGDDTDRQPSKQAKGKQPVRYQGDMEIKLEGLIPVKDMCMLGRTA